MNLCIYCTLYTQLEYTSYPHTIVIHVLQALCLYPIRSSRDINDTGLSDVYTIITSNQQRLIWTRILQSVTLITSGQKGYYSSMEFLPDQVLFNNHLLTRRWSGYLFYKWIRCVCSQKEDSNEISLMHKLRWATVGYHHDWDTKVSLLCYIKYINAAACRPTDCA